MWNLGIKTRQRLCKVLICNYLDIICLSYNLYSTITAFMQFFICIEVYLYSDLYQ